MNQNDTPAKVGSMEGLGPNAQTPSAAIPTWDSKAEAMLQLNAVEAIAGGSNGPTIRLRAEIEARFAICDMLRGALRSVVSHWREFGPEHGFDECVEIAARALGSNVGAERQ